MDASSFVFDWLEALHSAGMDPKTILSYRRGIENFISWNRETYQTAFMPSSTIGRDVADWKAYQQTVQRARPATVNQRLAALGSFFRWAASQGLVTHNPVDGIRTLRREQLRPKSLDKRIERLFLRAVHQSGNLRDIAIVELLLGTGLRVSELLSLKATDLEIDERSGKVVVRKGKHSTYREIPLTANVRKALSNYLDQRQTQPSASASLWSGQRGGLQDRSAVNRILEKYALMAQIEPFGPHILRHTFGARYLESNPGDLRGLASIFGHRNLNTVMYYTEPSLADLAERMEKME